MKQCLISMFLIGVFIIANGQKIDNFNLLQNDSSVNAFLNNINLEEYSIIDAVSSDGSIVFNQDYKPDLNKVINLLKLKNEKISYRLDRVSSSQFNKNRYYYFYQQYYNSIKVNGSSFLLTVIKLKGQKEIIESASTHLHDIHQIETLPITSTLSLKTLKKINPKWSVLDGELIYTNMLTGRFDLYWKIKLYDHSYKTAYVNAMNGVICSIEDNSAFINGTTRNYGVVNFNVATQGNISYMKTPDQRITLYQGVNLLPAIIPSSFNDQKIPQTTNSQTFDNDAWKHSIQAFHAITKVDKVFKDDLNIHFNKINIGTHRSESAYSFDFYPLTSRNAAYLLVGLDDQFDLNGPNYALYDVIAHELGHSYLFNFLDYSENIPHTNILHEGLSDIFGTYAEQFIKGNTDWIQGGEDEVIKTRINRDQSQYACFTDPNLTTRHQKSRAVSHWFYLVSNSSIGMTQTYNIFREGINLLNYRQASVYTFKNNTLQIVASLYGQNSSEYNILKSAWDIVCIDQQCPLQADVFISSNSNVTYQNENIGGNVIVESGGTLTITGSNFIAKDKFIKVKDGGKLFLNLGSLDVCEGTGLWSGIIVEEGGTITVDFFSIYNATTGITCYNRSILKLFNPLTITGNRRLSTGLLFPGNIGDAGGVSIIKYHKDYDVIKNCKYGTRIENNCSVTISIFKFIDCSWGASIINNGNLSMEYSTISGDFYGGVSCFDSELLANQCTIGALNNRGNLGISAINSTFIVLDCQIFTYGRCINASFSPFLVRNNTLDVSGSFNNKVKGCFIFGSNNDISEIDNNYFFSNRTNFGVFGEYISPLSLTNNEFNITDHDYMFGRAASIFMSGGIGADITGNIIDGDNLIPGIKINNSSNNNLICNQISNTSQGINTLYNSDFQTLKANILNTSSDLEIRSVLGQQFHHGNSFIGGSAKALGLSSQEIDQSRFYVNDSFPYHLPINPSPIDMFVPENNPNPANCDNIVIGHNINDDPTDKLCNYYAHLKSLPDSLHNRFFINMYHLLRSSSKIKGFRIPDCIKNDSLYWQLCGLMDIIRVSTATDTLKSSNAISDSLRSLLRIYLSERDSSLKVENYKSLRQHWKRLSLIRLQNKGRDSLLLDSLSRSVSGISCTSPMVHKWKDVLLILIRFKQTGQVSNADKITIETISSLCADEWGDVVHLARVLVGTYLDFNFSSKDDCRRMDDGTPRSILSGTDHTIQIFPNPSSGIITIKVPQPYSGNVIAATMDGKIILNKYISGVNNYSLDFSGYKGLLILKFNSDSGDISHHKVLITQY